MLHFSMNLLSIDYGTKRIGLAISIKGVISPLKTIKNDKNLLFSLQKITNDYRIDKIYIGICQGAFALATTAFIKKFKTTTKIPIETVEEAVSTIQADQIFKRNKNKAKNYQKHIDSIAAAVILSRVQV